MKTLTNRQEPISTAGAMIPYTIHSRSVNSSSLKSLIKSFITLTVLDSCIPENVTSVAHPFPVLCRRVTLLGSYLPFLDKPHQP